MLKILQSQGEEKIVAHIRKHWFVMVIEGIVLTIFALLPPLAVLIIKSSITLSIGVEVFSLGLVFYFAWLILIWILFFLAWTDHYLDAWVVTDQRVIDIEQKGIFNREVSSLRLDKIQDITVSVNGFLATILSFGDLHVQTAGQQVEITFKNVSRPYEAKDIISKLHDQATKAPQSP